MSEMATRISDGNRVKIGTCNSMYYCRFDQLDQIRYDHDTKGMLWRIPVPDEDGIKPGDFEHPIIHTKYIPYDHRIDSSMLKVGDIELMTGAPGLRQLTDEYCGLTVNINCYHGLKLPESGKEVMFFWNGKTEPLYLSFLENADDQMFICVSCRCCGKIWGFGFNEIFPAIMSLWMKLRLWHICTEYWFRCINRKVEDKPKDMFLTGKKNRAYRLTTTGEGEFELVLVKENPEDRFVEARGRWEDVRDKLLVLMENRGEVYEMRKRYLSGK